MKIKYYNFSHKPKGRLKAVTVHGRFQPPLHINHWLYIKKAFDIADKVIFLITNPYLKERKTSTAEHRSDPKHNPLTYNQRVKIFKSFFHNKGIPSSRYGFKPFDIRNTKTWGRVLNKNIPNVINTYGSPWSQKKLEDFVEAGFPVIRLSIPKKKSVSGTLIREIYNHRNLSTQEIKNKLIRSGYQKEAWPALIKEIFLYEK